MTTSIVTELPLRLEPSNAVRSSTLDPSAPPLGRSEMPRGSGGNLVPAGGYGALVDLLAAGLEVRLGTTVARIDHGGAEVLVVTDRGTFDADHAIVTVPLGVLRAGAVTFDPQLDGAHASAVEHLEMGTEEKVVFRFSERFWPESV